MDSGLEELLTDPVNDSTADEVALAHLTEDDNDSNNNGVVDIPASIEEEVYPVLGEERPTHSGGMVGDVESKMEEEIQEEAKSVEVDANDGGEGLDEANYEGEEDDASLLYAMQLEGDNFSVQDVHGDLRDDEHAAEKHESNEEEDKIDEAMAAGYDAHMKENSMLSEAEVDNVAAEEKAMEAEAIPMEEESINVVYTDDERMDIATSAADSIPAEGASIPMDSSSAADDAMPPPPLIPTTTYENISIDLPEDTPSRYFVLKAVTVAEIIKSYADGQLLLSDATRDKLLSAVHAAPVTVVVTVAGSRFFHGYGPILLQRAKQIDGSAVDSSVPSLRVSVVWKKLCVLSYDISEEVINRLDGNRRVNAALDGQEVNAEAAEKLISLLNKCDDETPDTIYGKLEKTSVKRVRADSTEEPRKKVAAAVVDTGPRYPTLKYDVTGMSYEEYLERLHQANYALYQEMVAQKQMELMAMSGGMMMGGMMMGGMMGRRPGGGGGGGGGRWGRRF